MMKLDDTLAAVFKTKLQAKKEKSKKKGEVLCIVSLVHYYCFFYYTT